MEASSDSEALSPSNFPLRFEVVNEGPGRPKRANVDILRTQLWVSIVMMRSGLTLYALEREFLPNQIKYNGSKVIRPRRLDRYRDGKMALLDVPGEDNLIDRVEVRFPGTAQWFRHPIWQALSHDAMSEAAILNGLKVLEPAVRRAVLTNKYPDGKQRSSHVPMFPRETQRRLIRRGSFDALGAVVLMARFAEIVLHPELRHAALSVYYELQPLLACHRYLEPFYPRLYTVIDFYCRRWLFFEHDPALRFDVIVTWQGMQQEVWRMQAKTNATRPTDG